MTDIVRLADRPYSFPVPLHPILPETASLSGVSA